MRKIRFTIISLLIFVSVIGVLIFLGYVHSFSKADDRSHLPSTQNTPEWKVISAAGNKMPKKKDVWVGIPKIKDQSTIVTLNKQQQTVLEMYLKNRKNSPEMIQFEATAENTFHALPDKTVMIVGRFDHYLAPTWVLRLSSTGVLQRDYTQLLSTTQSLSFMGYADGIVYISGGFGDGGGRESTVYALELDTGAVTKLQDEEQFMAGTSDPDPDFLPSDCNHKPPEQVLLPIAKQLSSRFDVRQDLIHVGNICGAEKLIVVPFAIPSKYHYGVFMQYTSGKSFVKVRTATGSSVFPPVFAQETSSDMSVLMQAFEKSGDGTYFYSQEYISINPYYDDAYGDEGHYNSKDNFKFCLTHSCAF